MMINQVHSTPAQPPEANATPAVAPTMHCVEETGIDK